MFGFCRWISGVVDGLLSIASAAAENSDREQTSTLTTTDDAAVDTETKVEGLLVTERATGLVQRWQRWWRKWGASECLSIASAAAEKSDWAWTLTSIMTDDAAVDTETKVEGFFLAARATELVQRRQRRSGSRETLLGVVGGWGCHGWRVGFLSNRCSWNLTVISFFVWVFWWRKIVREVESVAWDVVSRAIFRISSLYCATQCRRILHKMGVNNLGPLQTCSPSSFCTVCSLTRPKDTLYVSSSYIFIIDCHWHNWVRGENNIKYYMLAYHWECIDSNLDKVIWMLQPICYHIFIPPSLWSVWKQRKKL